MLKAVCAAKSMVKYCVDNKDMKVELDTPADATGS